MTDEYLTDKQVTNEQIDFSGAISPQKPLCIIGLGLIGGSVAHDLHAKGFTLYGVDTDSQARQLATRSTLFKAVYESLDAVPNESTSYVIATPGDVAVTLISAIEKRTAHLDSQKNTAVDTHINTHFILDLASTKSHVIEAMARLPPHIGAIGGHPMAGKTENGFAAAEPALFAGKTFVLCPVKKTHESATNTSCEAAGQAFASAIGADCLTMDPYEHDHCAAYISHLPHVIAYALADLVLKQPPENAVRMAASGFEGASRLSGSESNMVVDMALGNKVNILRAVDQYIESIKSLRTLLATGNKSSLLRYLEGRKSDRHAFLRQQTDDGRPAMS